MSSQLSLLALTATTIAALVGAVFAFRKLWHLLRPIHIHPSVKIIFDGSGPDEVMATILNRSRETQYVVKCTARSVYPLQLVFRRYLKHPLLRPRFFKTLRFAPLNFSLLDGEAVKLEPFAQVELRHRISKHPLEIFLTPLLQVEAQLSTRRVFRSRRFEVPDRWRFKRKVADDAVNQSPTAA